MKQQEYAWVRRAYQKLCKFSSKILRMLSFFLQRLNHKQTVKLIKQELNPICSKHGEDIFDKLSFGEYRRLSYQIRECSFFIVRAAIARVNSENEIVEIYSVASPGHHAEVLFYMASIGIEEDVKYTNRQISGFLDNHGRFLNRTEAHAIAKAAKQILVDDFQNQCLFSEQLWVLTDENERFKRHYRFNLLSKLASFLTSLSVKIKYL